MVRLRAFRVRTVVALASLAMAVPAGCRSRAPVAPSPPEDAVTFTIDSTGVTPKTAGITIGARVLFVNNDTRTHSIVSDPHPDESDCPNINQVGFLRPGDRHETGNFVTARVCGFHDHDAPTDQAMTGTITIQ